MILDLEKLPEVNGIVVVGNSTIVTFKDSNKSTGMSDYALEVETHRSDNSRMEITAKLGSVQLTNSVEIWDFVNKLQVTHKVYNLNADNKLDDLKASGFNLT